MTLYLETPMNVPRRRSMPQLRTILVPTDFSPDAERALDQAISLSRVVGSSIRLLHCFSAPAEIEPFHLDDGAEWPGEDIRNAAKEELLQVAARAAGMGLTITPALAFGHPAGEILRAASSHTDLVVMGALGRTGIGRRLLGSVAARIAREAVCPVLVVRPKEHSSRPRTVLVPIDLSAGLDGTSDLLPRPGDVPPGSRMVLLYVHDPQDTSNISVQDGRSRSFEKLVRDEIEILATQMSWAGVRCEARIEEGHASSVIAACARQEEADLIVMGSHGQSSRSTRLLGRVAEGVLGTAPCSVLVLHPC